MSGADAYDLGHRDRLALQGPDTPAFLNRLFTATESLDKDKKVVYAVLCPYKARAD